MRLALLVLLSVAAMSCSPMSRSIPRAALSERARAGGEPAATPAGLAAVAFASAQVGRGYCWGGQGPSCFDCSGLVQRAWSLAGVQLPRTSGAMGEALEDVPVDQVRAGDVLWWPGHVALYAGSGWAIEALDSRHGVVRRPVADPFRALRPGG